MRIIDSEDALAEGLRAIAGLDPVLGGLIAGGARPPLRKREPGFAGLAWMVVSQQLSVASANAIWAKVNAAFPNLDAGAIAGAGDEALRAAGLSAPKMRTLRAIAAAIDEGALPLDSLHDLPADEAHRLMVAVKGIGPWTADLYLLSCLGHPDAFPAGDLALQEAARLAFGMEGRPTEKAFTIHAERWRPWRAVAARVLWTHYGMVKARQGASV